MSLSIQLTFRDHPYADTYCSLEEMLTYKRQLVKHPAYRLRWGADTDILAATVLFNVNIHSHTRTAEGDGWQNTASRLLAKLPLVLRFFRSHNSTNYFWQSTYSAYCIRDPDFLLRGEDPRSLRFTSQLCFQQFSLLAVRWAQTPTKPTLLLQNVNKEHFNALLGAEKLPLKLAAGTLRIIAARALLRSTKI